MALHFVSTSISSSSDGISFDTEEVKESQEIIQARRAADAASKKSLYEQLGDQQEKKKAEYDENTKLIFAPPKALDEEDVEHFRQVDERHKQYLDSQKQMDEKQLEEFRRNSLQHSTQSNQPLKIHKIKEEKKPIPTIVVKRKKKKDETGAHSSKRTKTDSKAPQKQTSASSDGSSSTNANEVQEVKRSETAVPPSSSLLGLTGYGSDSDSDSDS